MERRIDLEGCFNFRDLGGYPTRDGRRIGWRRLFRSDGLHALTHGDVDRLRDGLGISDLIDLRSSAELASEGRGLLASQPIRFHHLPLYDGSARRDAGLLPPAPLGLAERYLGLLEVAAEPMARILATLSEARGGVVYHCAAGKDRTGVLSAVLLGLLGVSDEVIVADYALSRETLDAVLERLNRLPGYREMLAELPPETQHAEPQTMVDLLAGVRDRWGSMDAYAEAIGVASSTVARLRERLLEV